MRNGLALSILLALATASLGQADPGDLGVYFDPLGSQSCTSATGFVSFEMYVAATDIGSFTGWEAQISFSDPSWFVLSRTLNPATALNVCSGDCFIVGLGACVDSGPVYTLVSYQVGYFAGPVAPNDVAVCLSGTMPSSFGGAPGYSTCADELVPFTLAQSGSPDYPDGCAVINPLGMCPVSTAERSWGTLKTHFGGEN